MPRSKQFFIFCLLLMGILFSPLTPARSASEDEVRLTEAPAETTNRAVSCSPSLDLTVLFAFRDKASQAEAESLLASWQSGVNTVWQDATARYGFGDDTCSLLPTIRLLELNVGETCGYLQYREHCVDVVHAALNRRGQVADLSQASALRHVAAYGEWTTGTTAIEAAHLIGHLLGLPDDFLQKDISNSRQLTRFPTPSAEEVTDGVIPSSPMVLDFRAMPSLFPTLEERTTIASAAGLRCDNSCYCGNGLLDSDRSERCDPNFALNSCAIGETCTDQCSCQAEIAVCGDGVLNTGEQCDPAARETCPASYQCGVDCTCNPAIPLPANVELPSYVCGNGICEQAESCTICYLDCRASLACQACGNGICESNESPISCQSDCGGE